MGRACLQDSAWIQLVCRSGGGVLVGPFGFAAVVVGIGDFGILYLLGNGVLCPVALIFPWHGLHHWLCCLQL